MNTNLNSPSPASRSISGEGWEAIAGALGSAFLLLKKVLGLIFTRPEPVSRAEFYAEMRDVSHRHHADHVALLEKLHGQHRELLAALERLGDRISALEAGVARLDERTRRQS